MRLECVPVFGEWSLHFTMDIKSDVVFLIRLVVMTGAGRSMLYSLLLFAIILSLLEMYREKLASSELLTIFGGFISSLLFLVLLTVSSRCLSCFFHSFMELFDLMSSNMPIFFFSCFNAIVF